MSKRSWAFQCLSMLPLLPGPTLAHGIQLPKHSAEATIQSSSASRCRQLYSDSANVQIHIPTQLDVPSVVERWAKERQNVLAPLPKTSFEEGVVSASWPSVAAAMVATPYSMTSTRRIATMNGRTQEGTLKLWAEEVCSFTSGRAAVAIS